jgi:hypothetical protein
MPLSYMIFRASAGLVSRGKFFFRFFNPHPLVPSFVLLVPLPPFPHIPFPSPLFVRAQSSHFFLPSPLPCDSSDECLLRKIIIEDVKVCIYTRIRY